MSWRQRLWPGWGVLIAGLALGVALAATPLLRVIGYEAAAAVGLLGPWLAAPTWFRRDDPLRAASPALRWGWGWLRGWLGVGLPPLLVLGVASIGGEVCDLGGGLAVWGLIVGGSLGYGALIGALASRRRVGWGLLALLWLAAGAQLGWQLATQPPLTAMHPFMGYFAGSIYDEGLGVPAGLLAYRLWGACLIGAALVALELAWGARAGQGRGAGWWVVLGALLVTFGVMASRRAELQIATDREAVGEVLAGRHLTPRFELRYAPGSWHAQQIDAIGRDHEARYDELKRWFGGEPLAPGERVVVWIYPDTRTKGRLMGSRRTLVARLWLRELHILYPEVGYPVMKHELAHVFSAPAGRGPLQLSGRAGGLLPNMGLVEGLAEASVGYRGELELHTWAAAMRRLGIAPPLRDLVRVEGFWTTSSGQAYVLTGSFVRFLIDQYGPAPFLQAYPDADFAAAYPLPLEALIRAWEVYIDALPLDEATLQQARYLFDKPTIFERRCARAFGAHRGEAAEWLELSRPDLALPCLESAAALSPDDPTPALDIAAVLAQLHRPHDALQRLDALLAADTLPPIQRAQALLLAGDLRWPEDPAAARAAFEAARSDALPLALRRGVEARLLALDAGFAQAPRLFDRAASTPLARVGLLTERLRDAPDDPLALYLLGRELALDHRDLDALPWLQRAAAAELPAPLRWETLRLLARAATVAGRPALAQTAAQRLADDPHAPSGLRAEAEEWAQRTPPAP